MISNKRLWIKKNLINSFGVYLFLLFFLVFDFSYIKIFSNNNVGLNDFVIKNETKKNDAKKASKSKMQEQTCEVFANQISNIADLQQKAAKVQKLLINQTGFYLESCNKSVLLRNNKEKIDEILRVSKDFEKKIESFSRDCDKYFDYISHV